MNKNLLFLFIAIILQVDFLIAQSPRSIHANKFSSNLKIPRTKITSFANYYIHADFNNLENKKESQVVPKRKLDSIISRGTGIQDIPEKKTYTYNEHGNVLEISEFEWDASQSSWLNLFKNEFTYDQNQNLINSISYQGDQFKWNKILNAEYIYNLSNQLQQVIRFNWDDSNLKWIFDTRDTLSYNQKNQIILVESYKWNENSKNWMMQYKAIEEYNAFDQLIQETGFEWEQSSRQWVNLFRSEWTFHPSGKIYQILSSLWDDSIGDWSYLSKTEDIYNASNQLVNFLDYIFDVNSNHWVATTRTEFIYDPNGNVISELYSTYDDIKLKWSVLLKLENTFNNNFSLQDLVLPFSDDYNLNNFHHMLLKTAYFDNSQGNFVNDANDLFYYSPIDVVKTQNANHLDFQISPNPAHDVVKFNFGNESNSYQFAVYSIDGQLVQSDEIKNNCILDIHKIPAGIYFYHIRDNHQERATGKLIIQK
ncbi:MAG: T9SS type A sorting domain-containing protein [Saprospiraceae bacterium]|nr:T9SS type A sorting domain-containing protein [Saprospiraceae bacterium]MBK7738303.1 T9SS type A sorting domain-containing protein [Saprospiraceae bacterium]MBK7913124.1 T9SS type A sorting domain-containing protein [Saprospiraceae bacterium]